MHRPLFGLLAALVSSQMTVAAPFNDPDDHYTLDVPEPWRVADTSSRPIITIMRPGEEYRRSQIVVAVTSPTGSLDAELSLTVGNRQVQRSETTVAGAPCVYGKWSLGAPHIGDVLICSIRLDREGVRFFSITSDGEEGVYPAQHAAFESIVQSVRWSEGTVAGPR